MARIGKSDFCLFEIVDGPHNVRMTHVPVRVVILVHQQDSRMLGLLLMQFQKIIRVFRQQD